MSSIRSLSAAQFSNQGEIGQPSAPIPSAGSAKTFSAIMRDSMSRLDSIAGEKAFRELGRMRNEIMRAKDIAPRELILYQIRASEFGLGVELVSKVGESISVTVRKFQANQG